MDDDNDDNDDTHPPRIIVRVGMVFRRGQKDREGKRLKKKKEQKGIGDWGKKQKKNLKRKKGKTN